jgi:porin
MRTTMATRALVAIATLLLLAQAGGSARAETPLVAVSQAPQDHDGGPDAPGESASAEQSASRAARDGEREMSHRCLTPARAHQIYWDCIGQPFEIFTDTLTRDLTGFRKFLGSIGIMPIASYTAQLMGNPSGGRTQGFTYAGALDAAIAVNLQQLLGVPGLSFVVSASWPTGQSLSTETIDNLFFVQSAFSGTGEVSLQQMFLQQDLFDGTLSIAAGRLAPGNTFASLPVFSYYLSGGINPIPGSLVYNDPTFAQSPPGVDWGAQIVYGPIVPLQIAVGVYNTNPFAAAGANHGVDFSLQQGNTGVLTVFQVNYRLNQAKTDTGLPGEYAIGGFYDTNRFSSLNPPPGTVSGNYAVYAMFQQMVFRDGGPGSRRGLTVWGEFALSPRQSASLIPYLVASGLSYRGLVPSRGRDVASVGVVSGILSRHVPDASAETVIEANYQATLSRGISITPDVQYVIKPSGNSRIKNAVVVGLQLAVSF